MPSRRAVRVLVFVGALVLASGNLWETFRRSTVPLELNGRVEMIEVRREKHPGVDDVHLVAIEGRTIHVDEAFAMHLDLGMRVVKRGWSTQVTVNGRDVTIHPSRDFYGMAIVMPLLLVILLVVLRLNG